ncbi:ATP-dependent RNA helicase SrmB [Enterovibrio makurazakiensis]|uniref:ATP-dependent RNA helicase SrmB n=1 Tax=Enterovibrio gelatinilyticus TaxID=2899819 RepID=A0ABT5R1J9_9GAMM|nr:ATP-dependent RNA helicase SrmB [Enterovibrio sp. ZSDZ42]MDD1794152.1 ATP-dependent RNA helicase SrmB [Enterovibrio sp. ZSDZ42]
MRTFAELELDPQLLLALDDIGFERPTAIQADVIPHGMDGRDVLASAPTGTGKTAAFVLPLLQHLLDFPRQAPGPARALILTPTRELAIQVADQARALAKHTDLKIITITGGISYQEHAEILGKTQDIVVATPGRLMEYVEGERFDCRAIESLVLDEADRMLDMGFGPAVDRLSNECRWRKQSMLFSATLEGKGITGFKETLLTDPVEVEAEPPRRERKKITQWYYRCDDMKHKYTLLRAILADQANRAIIFVKTRDRLAALREELTRQKINCAWIQGEMAQAKRTNAIERFSKGEVNFLLATDVAARGIDVPNISHVINFDLPRKADVYLHRIGRTARAGKKGNAISLVEAHDQPMMDRICRYMNEDVKERYVEGMKPSHKKPAFKKKKVKAPKKVLKAKAKKVAKKAAKKSAKKTTES